MKSPGQADDALPEGFEALLPYVKDWGALTSQDARYRMRQCLPMPELRAFYTAAVPLLPAIFEHLDGFAYGGELPEPSARLYRVVLGMSEVAQAVEVYGKPGVPLAPPAHSVPIEIVPPRTR